MTPTVVLPDCQSMEYLIVSVRVGKRRRFKIEENIVGPDHTLLFFFWLGIIKTLNLGRDEGNQSSKIRTQKDNILHFYLPIYPCLRQNGQIERRTAKRSITELLEIPRAEFELLRVAYISPRFSVDLPRP